MKHYGDITKLSGYELPVVDVITGGSPCQDLSVAGKRAGLAGERSGLFMEQMRIIKEMRANDRRNGRAGIFIRPRYMVWENVPGAFSSKSGEDFAAVIEEIIKVCEPGADLRVPVPDKGWTKSGCYYADDGSWSLAWRVHDAQLWGVPQRRKRISLVADFGGLSAPEILFERKGLRGDTEPGGAAREGTAGGVEEGADRAIGFTNRGYDSGNVTETLRSDPHGAYPCVGVDVYNQEITGDTAASLTAAAGGTNTSGPKVLAAGFSFGQSAKARSIGYEEEKSPTLRGGEGGNQKPCCLVTEQQPRSGGAMNPWDPQSARVYPGDGVWHSLNANENGGQSRDAVLAFAQNQRDEVRDLGDKAGSLAAEPGMKQQTYVMAYALDQQGGKGGANFAEDVCPPILSDSHGTPHAVAYGISSYESNAMKSSNPHSGVYEADTARTLDLNGGNPACNQGGVAVVQLAVFENHSQDSRYKLLGDISETVNAKYGTGGNNQPLVVFDKEMYNSGEKMTGEMQARYDDVAPTVRADSHPSGVCTSIVRRLTPLECERLQGFPDGWTDIGDWTDSKGKKRKAADGPRYKALGNSIALPFWQFLARRICAQYERDITLGSLFDGIGGFPYVFERCGAKAVWASEIEEFAIAVTKLRFPEETRY